jgi:hypothetical protein
MSKYVEAAALQNNMAAIQHNMATIQNVIILFFVALSAKGDGEENYSFKSNFIRKEKLK